MENNIGKETGVFCFLANLRYYFSCYHEIYEECQIGGMIGCFGFAFNAEATDTQEVIYGRNQTFSEMLESMQRLFIKPIEKYCFKEAKELITFIQESIKKDKPILIWLDEYYLPHSIYYKKEHFKGLVVIMSLEESQINFYDNEPIKIEAEVFKKAMIKDEEGFSFFYHNREEIAWQKPEDYRVAEGLEVIITQMNDKGNKGIEGMKRFRNALCRCEDGNTLYNYFYQMNRGSGLHKTRHGMALLCEDLYDKRYLEEAKECAISYHTLSLKWQNVTNLIYKLSITEDKYLKERILLRIDEIIHLEEQGIPFLKKMQMGLLGLHKELLRFGG